MKSSHPFFIRRAVIAAAVVLASGAAYADSTSQSGTSRSSSSSPNRAQSGSQSGSSQSSQYGSSSQTGSSYNQGSSSHSSGSHQQDTAGMSASSSSSQGKKLGWGDKRFITKAADSGMLELQVAQLAAQKAQNPDVKQFAQQLIQDHTKANQKLMTIASAKNVELDKDDVTKDRAYRRLNDASSGEFDREFVEFMADQHESDVKLFQKASENAKDQEVRQFASSTLPHLQQHLQHVQQLQRSVQPTGSDDQGFGSRTSETSNSSNSNLSTSNTGGSATSGSSAGFNSGSSSSGSGSSSSAPAWGSSSTSSGSTGTGTTGTSGSGSSTSSSTKPSAGGGGR